MTPTAAAAAPLAPAMPPMAVQRLTVKQYLRLVDGGAFENDEKLELLDGWMVPKMTQGPPHNAILFRLMTLLQQRMPAGLLVRPQLCLLTGDSVPEPDLAVISGAESSFRRRHPRADEASLVIEVSDKTLRHDRGLKSRLYARAAVPEYWIVEVKREVVDRRRQPHPVAQDWRDRTTVAGGGKLSWTPPGAAGPVVIAVAEIFA